MLLAWWSCQPLAVRCWLTSRSKRRAPPSRRSRLSGRDVGYAVEQFVYVAWFRDSRFALEDQDAEWPACFVIQAPSAPDAKAWDIDSRAACAHASRRRRSCGRGSTRETTPFTRSNNGQRVRRSCTVGGCLTTRLAGHRPRTSRCRDQDRAVDGGVARSDRWPCANAGTTRNSPSKEPTCITPPGFFASSSARV